MFPDLKNFNVHNLRNQALALALAVAGALVARAIHLPMPWLLGAMIATGAAAFLGAPVSANPTLRSAMLITLGVLLGSAFQVSLLAGLGNNVLIIAMLIPYTLLTTFLVYLLLRRFSKLDPVTAFFSSVPGGVNEMIMMGTERGGSEPALAVHHSIRLFLVVLFVSVGFGLIYGFTRPAVTTAPFFLSPMSDYLVLILLGGLGWLLSKLVRLPAAFVLGPMIVSAFAHLTGATDLQVDGWLVATAQLVTGSAIGTRFADFERRELQGAIATSLIISVALIILTFAFVSAIQPFTGRPITELMLAFAPGGLAEMGLIAMTFGGDADFVSASQVCRFFVVVTIAVPLFRLSVMMRRAPEPIIGPEPPL